MILCVGDVHRIIGLAALVLAAVAIVLSVILVAVRRPPGILFLVDVAVLGLAVLGGALLGLVLLVTGPGPRDPLHLLYGALALVAVPAGYGIAGSRPERQQAAIALVASVVILLLLVRLLQTGGT